MLFIFEVLDDNELLLKISVLKEGLEIDGVTIFNKDLKKLTSTLESLDEMTAGKVVTFGEVAIGRKEKTFEIITKGPSIYKLETLGKPDQVMVYPKYPRTKNYVFALPLALEFADKIGKIAYGEEDTTRNVSDSKQVPT